MPEIHTQIEIETIMRAIGNHLNTMFKEIAPDLGFALIVFEFNNPGVSNYISNANRKDMIEGLKETVMRLENNEDISETDNKGNKEIH